MLQTMLKYFLRDNIIGNMFEIAYSHFDALLSYGDTLILNYLYSLDFRLEKMKGIILVKRQHQECRSFIR